MLFFLKKGIFHYTKKTNNKNLLLNYQIQKYFPPLQTIRLHKAMDPDPCMFEKYQNFNYVYQMLVPDLVYLHLLCASCILYLELWPFVCTGLRPSLANFPLTVVTSDSLSYYFLQKVLKKYTLWEKIFFLYSGDSCKKRTLQTCGGFPWIIYEVNMQHPEKKTSKYLAAYSGEEDRYCFAPPPLPRLLR